VGAMRIVSDPNVMLGKPVDQILDSHPTLTREGVLSAIKYAVDILRLDVVYPVGA
jgi:uncharacterized protein (DUF433 family)